MKRPLLAALTLAPVRFSSLTNPLVIHTLTAPADWSWFYCNGPMTETADGLTSSGNSPLIYGAAIPGNYDVRSRLKLTTGGGSYAAYVRASSDTNLLA